MWNGSLITNIFQDACPGDQITEAIVLAPGEAVLFFGRCSLQLGLLCNNVWDVEVSFCGPVNWGGRTVQVDTTINTMQEGCQAIADAVMEKKMKTRDLSTPKGQGDPPSPQLPPMMSMIGCKA